MKLERRKGAKRRAIAKRRRWLSFPFLTRLPFSVDNETGGLPGVHLFEPGGSSAEVLLSGGKVVSWKNDQGEELLFMSGKNVGRPSEAIKGGIYVCFLQFPNLGSFDYWPMHLIPTGNPSSVDLILKTKANNLNTCSHSFEFHLHVSLGPGKLTLISRLTNTGGKSVSFRFALHNYITVSDISEVRVEGLETLDYYDNLLQGDRFTEQSDAITFDGKVDRVYIGTPATIAVVDHGRKRTFVIRKEGLADSVLWNPRERVAEDCNVMLCIGSAVLDGPVVLKPAEEWRFCQEILTVSSSYCSGQLDPRTVLRGLR